MSDSLEFVSKTPSYISRLNSFSVAGLGSNPKVEESPQNSEEHLKVPTEHNSKRESVSQITVMDLKSAQEESKGSGKDKIEEKQKLKETLTFAPKTIDSRNSSTKNGEVSPLIYEHKGFRFDSKSVESRHSPTSASRRKSILTKQGSELLNEDRHLSTDLYRVHSSKLSEGLREEVLREFQHEISEGSVKKGFDSAKEIPFDIEEEDLGPLPPLPKSVQKSTNTLDYSEEEEEDNTVPSFNKIKFKDEECTTTPCFMQPLPSFIKGSALEAGKEIMTELRCWKNTFTKSIPKRKGQAMPKPHFMPELPNPCDRNLATFLCLLPHVDTPKSISREDLGSGFNYRSRVRLNLPPLVPRTSSRSSEQHDDNMSPPPCSPELKNAHFKKLSNKGRPVMTMELKLKVVPDYYHSSTPELNERRYDTEPRPPCSNIELIDADKNKGQNSHKRGTTAASNPFQWPDEEDIEKSSFSEMSEMKQSKINKSSQNPSFSGLYTRKKEFKLEVRNQSSDSPVVSPLIHEKPNLIKPAPPRSQSFFWPGILLLIAGLILIVEFLSTNL